MSKQKTSKEEVNDDIGKYSALEAVANSEGGKILIKATTDSINSSIAFLTSSFKTASHVELISMCAVLNEHISLLNVLKNAPKNKYFAIEALKTLDDEDTQS